MKKVFKKVATSALAATLVLPAGIAGAATKFPDVNPNTVTPDVQQAIEALAEQGIIQGFPDGTFGPNKSITRAQFAKILAQVKGLQPNPAAAAQFTDVKDPEQKGWVGALYAAGLTTGTTATTYSPNRPIQRDQAATFLVRALGLEEVAQELNLTPTTTDGARINASHKANVGLLEKIGLVKGYPNGAYGPGDPFKRQQAANLLYKVQQEGDTYVAAAHALLNKVEVVYNDNGTLTIKGSIKGAAKVDVVVREAEAATTQAAGDVLFEQKGVEVKDGAFEVTTSFIGNKAVTVSVTAYDANGNVITTLEQKAQPSQDGEVQGYTDAPDLIHAYSDGKYVYFVFDEPINKILDKNAFKVFTFGGTPVEAKDVRLESDKVTVRADFYNAGIPAISTVAYVEEGAVNDEDRNESIEGIVPLNNVDLTKGATAGPDLVSVRISPFSLNAPELKDDPDNKGQKKVVTEGTKDFTVEYKFDEKISKVDTSKPESFVLFLKDGTMLAGTDIVNEKSDTVEVKFEVEYSANLNNAKTDIDEYVIVSGDVKSEDKKVESKLSKSYAGKAIDRDAIALAAVLPGAVKDDDSTPGDDKSPNPLTVTKARASLSANYLRSVDVDLKNAKLTYKFDRSVEGLEAFSNAVLEGTNKTKAQRTVEEYFGVYTISGESKTFSDETLSKHIKKVTVDNKSVTVELDKKEEDVARALASVVGAYVLPVDDIVVDEGENEEQEEKEPEELEEKETEGETFAVQGENGEPNGQSEEGQNEQDRVIVVGTLGADKEQDRVIGGAAPISRSYKAGENFAPMLKKYEASYDEDDELLTLTLVFTQDIDKVNKDEIVFFNANGEKVDADVTVDDIKHDEVVLEIEIDADDYEEIVAFALKHGFAESGADGYVGTPSVPAVMPY